MSFRVRGVGTTIRPASQKGRRDRWGGEESRRPVIRMIIAAPICHPEERRICLSTANRRQRRPVTQKAPKRPVPRDPFLATRSFRARACPHMAEASPVRAEHRIRWEYPLQTLLAARVGSGDQAGCHGDSGVRGPDLALRCTRRGAAGRPRLDTYVGRAEIALLSGPRPV